MTNVGEPTLLAGRFVAAGRRHGDRLAAAEDRLRVLPARFDRVPRLRCAVPRLRRAVRRLRAAAAGAHRRAAPAAAAAAAPARAAARFRRGRTCSPVSGKADSVLCGHSDNMESSLWPEMFENKSKYRHVHYRQMSQDLCFRVFVDLGFYCTRFYCIFTELNDQISLFCLTVRSAVIGRFTVFFFWLGSYRVSIALN